MLFSKGAIKRKKKKRDFDRKNTVELIKQFLLYLVLLSPVSRTIEMTMTKRFDTKKIISLCRIFKKHS